MISTADLMNAIQERMADKGMTQADVARKSGLSQPHVSNLFTGKIAKPQFETALRLCEAAGIKVQFTVPRQPAK